FVHTFGGRGTPLGANVNNVDEEVRGELAWSMGKDTPVRGLAVDAENAQAAHEHGHLWSGQGEHIRLVQETLLGTQPVPAPIVVAEAVGNGLERLERLRIGLLLRGVGPTGSERDGD